MTEYERKLKKIVLNIERLALKGKENYIEFSKYVDSLVARGDYSPLIEVLYTWYSFDGTLSRNVDELKKLSWKEILFQTQAPFLQKLKKIYDSKKVFQNSFDIYSNNLDNVNISVSDALSTTFSNTGLESSFALVKNSNGSVDLKVGTPSVLIGRDNLYSFKLYTADWIIENANFVPSKEKELQNIIVGTQTKIHTDINLDLVRQYWIYTEERQNMVPGYTYSSAFVSTPALASFSFATNSVAKGYLTDVSTNPDFSTQISGYTSFVLGTQSSYNYIVSGETASVLVDDLDSNSIYYWRVRDAISTYVASFNSTGGTGATGGTGSIIWPELAGAQAYAIDLATQSSFEYLIPEWRLTIATISTTSSYFKIGSWNYYDVFGLTQGTHHYRVRALLGNTQSGSFTTSDSLGTASWPISEWATKYHLSWSKDQTFNSGVNSANVSSTTFSGTYSYVLDNLDSNSIYYYRVNFSRGYNRTYNYKIDLTATTFLGQIYEIELFNPDAKYYLLNKQYASLIGARSVYLEVHKFDISTPSGFATASYFTFTNPKLTEEQNLLQRYSQAIDYLNF
jgi:hypothetical protein